MAGLYITKTKTIAKFYSSFASYYTKPLSINLLALEALFVGWTNHDDKLRASDSSYTEVIHTNAGLLGYLATLGHADFYPNGGVSMPGCGNQDCDHARFVDIVKIEKLIVYRYIELKPSRIVPTAKLWNSLPAFLFLRRFVCLYAYACS